LESIDDRGVGVVDTGSSFASDDWSRELGEGARFVVEASARETGGTGAAEGPEGVGGVPGIGETEGGGVILGRVFSLFTGCSFLAGFREEAGSASP